MDAIRHIILNKTLCIQGKCLACNGKDLTSSNYKEVKGMCTEITDAASQLPINIKDILYK